MAAWRRGCECDRELGTRDGRRCALQCCSLDTATVEECERWVWSVVETRDRTVALPEGMEVVDVTGCGNTSTAGACCAWCEGNDPIMTGIMANISANYNLRQIGPYPNFTDDVVREAHAFAQKLYADGNYYEVD